MPEPNYYNSPANVLARELAERLGGKHVPPNGDGKYLENYANVELDGFILTIDRAGYGALKDRVVASVMSIPRKLRVSISVRRKPLGGARGADAIAKDVLRRVLAILAET